MCGVFRVLLRTGPLLVFSASSAFAEIGQRPLHPGLLPKPGALPFLSSGNRLTARDGKGGFYSAATRYNGKNSYIQLSKLGSANFAITWNAEHDEGIDERAHAVHIDDAGNIFVAGSRRDGKAWKGLLLKFDPSGKLLWEAKLKSEFDSVPSALAVTQSGTIYVGASAYNGTHYVARLYKLWNVGFVDWSRDYSNGTQTYLTGIMVEKESPRIAVESAGGALDMPSRRVIHFTPEGSRQ